jgi:dienelactone hydrolase
VTVCSDAAAGPETHTARTRGCRNHHKREMVDAGADWQLTVYGEGFHAFTAPDMDEQGVPGAADDAFLDRLSWAQATAFLAATLAN